MDEYNLNYPFFSYFSEKMFGYFTGFTAAFSFLNLWVVFFSSFVTTLDVLMTLASFRCPKICVFDFIVFWDSWTQIFGYYSPRVRKNELLPEQKGDQSFFSSPEVLHSEKTLKTLNWKKMWTEIIEIFIWHYNLLLWNKCWWLGRYSSLDCFKFLNFALFDLLVSLWHDNYDKKQKVK